MIKSLISRISISAVCSLLLAACSGPEFSVEGTVKDAGGHTMVLERQDPVAGWLALDSLKLEADGSFRFEVPAPENPEMYRLLLDGRYVYLPVDSIDALSLTGSLQKFDTDFRLSGSKQAEQLTAFEHEAVRVEALSNPDSTAAFRKRVYNSYLRDARGNILSYHILTRPMGSGWLIDYTDPLYAAVATAFETYRPNDPHTAHLTARAKEGVNERRRAAGAGTRLQATATGVIPVTLPGIDGKDVALSSLLGKGKPVVVAFVAMTREDAPAINRELRSLYDAGRADVYEICLDADQFAWREASRALPWTVVLDPEGAQSRVALQYNVGSLPAFFIYNAAGDLVQSTGKESDLKKYL